MGKRRINTKGHFVGTGGPKRKALQICMNCKQTFYEADMEAVQENDKSPIEYYCNECWDKIVRKELRSIGYYPYKYLNELVKDEK